MKNIFLNLIVIVAATLSIESFSQANNPPVVKIMDPLNKGKYNLGHYLIKVSDKEDGESVYDEIATNEVFLEVRYLPDVSNVSTTATPDPNGLATMKKSNCFNCHAFNGKLIAPSFYEITKRYPSTEANIRLLSKRIREGSGGIWGTASMPSHTELSNQQAQEIVNWILKNGEDPNLNYYVGIEGTFKMRLDPVSQKGGFLLSATYSDHGGLASKHVIVTYLK